MSIVLLMLPIAIILGFSFLLGFIWATKKGQFDDLDTPAYKILIEDKNERT